MGAILLWIYTVCLLNWDIFYSLVLLVKGLSPDYVGVGPQDPNFQGGRGGFKFST